MSIPRKARKVNLSNFLLTRANETIMFPSGNAMPLLCKKFIQLSYSCTPFPKATKYLMNPFFFKSRDLEVPSLE